MEYEPNNPRVTVEVLQKDKETSNLLNLLNEKQLYHNYDKAPSQHVIRVINAVSILSKLESISNDATELLRIAALYHDVGYPNGSINHEERSAEIAGTTLKRFDLNPQSIATVKNSILATQGTFKDGTIVTSPQTLEQKILCDADMSIVGEDPDVFLEVNDLLRQEIGDEVGASDKNIWNNRQILFYERLRWHTHSASVLWEEQKQINIQAIKKLISR